MYYELLDKLNSAHLSLHPQFVDGFARLNKHLDGVIGLQAPFARVLRLEGQDGEEEILLKKRGSKKELTSKPHASSSTHRARGRGCEKKRGRGC